MHEADVIFRMTTFIMLMILCANVSLVGAAVAKMHEPGSGWGLMFKLQAATFIILAAWLPYKMSV